MLVSTIRDKINDLGKTSSARRFVDMNDPQQSDNKLSKLLRGRLGLLDLSEEHKTKPRDQLRQIYMGKLD